MMQITPAGPLQLAVFASGRGSNFDALYQAIERGDLNANIKVLVSDKENAPALDKARKRNIKAIYLNPRSYINRDEYENDLLKLLKEQQVTVVVLAGYMRLVGPVLLEHFRHRIVNIHPALLPSFPGLQAQQQAVDYGVKYSGCTVHIVDAGMDTGPILMQAVVPVLPDDSGDTLAQRILVEEHKIYWRSLQLLAEGRVYIDGRKAVIKN
ncbi:MAG TPA: phosphoribosylglycinamide formyltransferase [Gelria sp.]|jgi:phosphoribosylglycinamide formyltransferase-1|nr:phosphoribosylglycinamide formyltransferase [Gelria sp.]